jgi:hypothetical protein
VRLHLEGDRVALADVDDPGVLADAGEQLADGRLGGRSPNLLRCTLLDLYEQCSDHMTEYIASSAAVGRRPRISWMRAYSSALRPSSAQGCSWSGVPEATATVSRRC